MACEIATGSSHAPVATAEKIMARPASDDFSLSFLAIFLNIVASFLICPQVDVDTKTLEREVDAFLPEHHEGDPS